MYTDGQPIHVCKDCGFIYVRRRRSAEDIARSWSDELFGGAYTARIPAVAARQTYVAEYLDDAIDLHGKSVCDIGGGEGLFGELLQRPPYGARVFAVEPSESNCAQMTERGIENFCGTIEEYTALPGADRRRFDAVTIMWTLENCQDCVGMLTAANAALDEGGHIVVATGSRILVPFKKPLHTYLSKTPIDTHAFRFSANSLRSLLTSTGFEIVAVNRFVDTDYLVVVGRKAAGAEKTPRPTDDWREVLDFFARWHRETEAHFPPA